MEKQFWQFWAWNAVGRKSWVLCLDIQGLSAEVAICHWQCQWLRLVRTMFWQRWSYSLVYLFASQRAERISLQDSSFRERRFFSDGTEEDWREMVGCENSCLDGDWCRKTMEKGCHNMSKKIKGFGSRSCDLIQFLVLGIVWFSHVYIRLDGVTDWLGWLTLFWPMCT